MTTSPIPRISARPAVPWRARSIPAVSRLLAGLGAALACAGAFGQAWHITPLGTFSPTGIDGEGRISGYSGGVPAVWDEGTVTLLPVAAGSQGVVNAVNDAGRIVGYMALASGADKAVSWTGGVRKALKSLGGPSSRAHGISSDGRVVGESQTADGAWHPALWYGGTVSRLKAMRDTDYTVAYGANSSGTYVGMSSFPARGTFSAQATIWVYGKPKQLKDLDGESVATGINDLGQAIGFGYLPNNINARALVWSTPSSAPIVLDDLAGQSSFAQGINGAGTVVGRSFTIDSQLGQHGVMWIGTQVTDLGIYVDPAMASEGWYVDDAVAINDSGWIVGTMRNDRVFPGQSQGFLLSP